MKKRLITITVIMMMVLNMFSLPAMAESRSVDTIISDMSIEDKIAQMFMVEFRQWNDGSGSNKDVTKLNGQIAEMLGKYHFGAILYFAENIQTTKDTLTLTKDIQQAAIAGGGLPMIIATDQEGGSVYRLGSGTALPGNMAVAATGDTEYSYAAGNIIGSELACLGINTTLSPVVDINNNPNNPVIGIRSFSDDANIVGNYASRMIDGMAANNVIGCAKHYPGHGDVSTDSHYGLPEVDKSKSKLLANELMPYKIAISKNIEMIMTAHILYPQLEKDHKYSAKTGEEEALPATMSDDLVSGLLKSELGFDGVVCTDAMNMAGVADFWNEDEAVINAINAGVDMICMPTILRKAADAEKLDAIIESVVQAVDDGAVSEDRINDACRRILELKEKKGILDYDADDYTLEKAMSVVGCDENRSMEREMAAAAVTVIQNKDNVLPKRIKADSKVLVMVPYDNESGQFVMAWNRAKDAGLIPDGAEIETVRFNSEYNNKLEDLQGKIDKADTIIINSELYSGDRKSNNWRYAAVKSFVKYAEDNGKTSVVMSVDAPYDVSMYPEADAVLAVYGCKGSSLDPEEAEEEDITEIDAACGPNITAGMEVILGVFDAQGKLPVNIPAFDKKNGNFSKKIVYKRGFGLKYSKVEPGYDPKPVEIVSAETSGKRAVSLTWKPGRQCDKVCCLRT